jgi:hypothetical protein
MNQDETYEHAQLRRIRDNVIEQDADMEKPYRLKVTGPDGDGSKWLSLTQAQFDAVLGAFA